ncbi:MAG: SPOR domain-containing protein [Pseudomonadales bacterium]
MFQLHVKSMVLTAVFSLFSSPFAYSAVYLVQIGAYQQPNDAALKAASEYGHLIQSDASNALTRVYVGKFANRTAAETARNGLLSIGYDGAFLVNYASVEASLADSNLAFFNRENNVENGNYESKSVLQKATVRASDSNTLDDLTEQERALVVYLDGKLKIKKGEQFMSLSEFRASR